MNLLGIVFISWPLIVFANIIPFEYELAVDVSNICNNETLMLNVPNFMSLGTTFIVSNSLRCFFMRNSMISFFEGSFDGVPNLQILDLQNNNIKPENLFDFGNISNVRILNLGQQNNYDNYYYETVIKGVYPQLEYLNLEGNGIYTLSNKWENPFPKLTHLYLSRNRIEKFSANFLPDTLTYLDLSNNKISQVSLQGLNNLLSLSLDNNRIAELYGQDFSGLYKLTNLSITNNQIDFVAFYLLGDMMNLRYLNLSANRLSLFPSDLLENLPFLESLTLDQNAIANIWGEAPSNITRLSLNCNNISDLRSYSFFNLTQLRQLFLSRNNIVDIDVDTFLNQNLLEELHLNDNHLTYLPIDWSQSMKNLRYLNLSGNKFTSLESINIFKLSTTQLNFERNPLEYINTSTLRMMANITIYLNITPTFNAMPCNYIPFLKEMEDVELIY